MGEKGDSRWHAINLPHLSRKPQTVLLVAWLQWRSVDWLDEATMSGNSLSQAESGMNISCQSFPAPVSHEWKSSNLVNSSSHCGAQSICELARSV